MLAEIIRVLSRNFQCDSFYIPYEQEEPFQTLELSILPSLSQTSLNDLVKNFQERTFILVPG